MLPNKNTLGLIIILIAFVAGGGYIWYLNRELEKAISANNEKIVKEISDLTEKGILLQEKNDKLKESLEIEITRREEIELKLIAQKNRSDEYYKKWKKMRYDINDTSVANLLTALRENAMLNTQASADNP